MTLTGADLLALLPLLVLTAGVIAVMLLAAFYRHPSAVMLLTLIVLALAFATLPLAIQGGSRPVTPLLTIDGFALFYMGLVFAATFAVTLFGYSYFRRGETRHEAFYILLLLAALGSGVLAAANHFASFVLALELLSVSLFALIAYPRESERPLEAGIKYLILAGVSTAFLLFGAALLYAETGALEFTTLGGRLAAGGGQMFTLAGVALVLVGVGFKLAVAPFHMWTPDVYEGAPAPVAAFIATVSKGAMLALLLRYFVVAGGYRSPSLLLVLEAIAVASILAGNLLALLQNNVKRILAYSSIAHLGYMLVAFLAAGSLAVEAVSYYLVAYFVTMLGAFGVVAMLSAGGSHTDTDSLVDYQGLFWRRPWIAGVFTAMLLSLAGIPMTMGFVAKFYVVTAGVGASLWLLVIVLVIGSAIGLFYYLRIIAAMAASVSAGSVEPQSIATTRTPAAVTGWTLAALTLLLLWLGIAPAPLMRLLQATVGHLT